MNESKENKDLQGIKFQNNMLSAEYYNCRFSSCDFSHLSLFDIYFENCVFDNCDFTLVQFKCALRDVVFTNSKLIGTNFSELNKCSGGIDFIGSCLDYAAFTTTTIKKTRFEDCKITEAAFNQTILTGSVFKNCELTDTSFAGANLERVDFTTAFNYTINPNTCKLKKTKFSVPEIKGLVAHLDIIIE